MDIVLPENKKEAETFLRKLFADLNELRGTRTVFEAMSDRDYYDRASAVFLFSRNMVFKNHPLFSLNGKRDQTFGLNGFISVFNRNQQEFDEYFHIFGLAEFPPVPPVVSPSSLGKRLRLQQERRGELLTAEEVMGAKKKLARIAELTVNAEVQRKIGEAMATVQQAVQHAVDNDREYNQSLFNIEQIALRNTKGAISKQFKNVMPDDHIHPFHSIYVSSKTWGANRGLRLRSEVRGRNWVVWFEPI